MRRKALREVWAWIKNGLKENAEMAYVIPLLFVGLIAMLVLCAVRVSYYIVVVLPAALASFVVRGDWAWFDTTRRPWLRLDRWAAR